MDEKIARLKTRFDYLIKLRDEARLKIMDELGFQKYQSLKKEAETAYRALQDARYDAGQGTLD